MWKNIACFVEKVNESFYMHGAKTQILGCNMKSCKALPAPPFEVWWRLVQNA
jgi:hypothetical protein